MLLRALLATVVSCAAAFAGVTGRGGLEAVAVSADGKVVAVGGQNRVVYLLDAATLEVKRRVWIGSRVGGIAFSKDGGRLLVEDESDRLHLLETDSGKALIKPTPGGAMMVSPAGDVLACRDVRAPAKHRLRLLTLDKLDEVRVVELPERPVAWTFDAAGKALFVLGAGRPCDEKHIPNAEAPSHLRGLERWAFRQKNDGFEAVVYQVDPATGKVAALARTWYTSDGDSTRLVRSGAATFVFNRVNLCAKIPDRGETTMFETAQVVNHAVAASPDGKHLILGGQGEGSLGPTEGGKREAFHLEALPGQAEYLNGFAVAGDGAAMGVTTAYRVVRINKFGQVEQVAAVY